MITTTLVIIMTNARNSLTQCINNKVMTFPITFSKLVNKNLKNVPTL